MEPGEALSAGAQVAATLAGFAGVVVVFGSGAVHEWSSLDKFRLRLMLTFSALPLGFCMAGMLLLTTELEQPSVWRWCSGLSAAFLLPIGVLNFKVYSGLPPEQLQGARGSRTVFYTLSASGTAVSLLQLYNITTLHSFWPFFSVIVMAILSATLQFIRMILSRQAPLS